MPDSLAYLVVERGRALQHETQFAGVSAHAHHPQGHGRGQTMLMQAVRQARAVAHTLYGRAQRGPQRGAYQFGRRLQGRDHRHARLQQQPQRAVERRQFHQPYILAHIGKTSQAPGESESFNGKFRDECLSLEWFRSRRETAVIIEAWRCHYNEVRPHSSLNYLTPHEFEQRYLSLPQPAVFQKCLA